VIETSAKASTLLVTAPRALTDDQRQNIRNAIAGQLPADVGVIVLDGSFTFSLIGEACSELGLAVRDLVPGELLQDQAPSLILAELRGLRAELAQTYAGNSKITKALKVSSELLKSTVR
jgi:hypothetical protein